ncbi:hypothetical protein ACFL4T_05350 [candidate division KSB1 bacterium]
MFCPKCRCEYPDWIKKCPYHDVPMLYSSLPDYWAGYANISYDELLKTVKENGEKLQTEVTATSIGMEKKWQFPYQGYGYAWAKRLLGASENILVDLRTTEVGHEKKWSFPYMGRGYGWEEEIQGTIGGNDIVLKAQKIEKEKKLSFPYFGFGYGWTQEMTGNCGKQLIAELSTTETGKYREFRFPFRGYGFAWIKKAVLTIKLKE